MDVALLKGTALLYLLATGTFIVYVLLLKDSLARISPLVLLSGFLLHTAALGVQISQNGFPAVTELHQALSVYSWVIVGVYLLVHLKYSVTVLGCFVAPLAFLMTFAGIAFGAAGGELPPGLKTYWLPVHVTLAFLGNAVFALAFAVSLMYLIQESRLKSKKTTALHQPLPSLERLDRLNYVFLVWGFPLMTLGIVTGILWAHVQWGDYWTGDARLISSTLVWLLYGVLLQGRITAGWRGRRAAFLTIVGFVVVLGYFLWGDSLFPSRHGGRFD
ncbi:MAG TPA: cytochrome c biogenesis protein [Candidatus Binatia bacterium]|jgi:cytochrome c-type biogenesis protein CcsB